MELNEDQVAELAQALASGIAQADALKREASKERERLDEAKTALDVAKAAYGGELLEVLEEQQAWPKAPDFKKLERYLLSCGSSQKAVEGIERELAWCAQALQIEQTDLSGLESKAHEQAGVFRERMLAFTRFLLAEGETLEDGAAPEFAGGFETWSQAKAKNVSELLVEVRAAFEKLRRVLLDNGSFALEPTIELGNPRLTSVIEEVREGNARPYRGPIDEDFMDHVDNFWLGFHKLGKVCSQRATADPTPLLDYTEQVARELGEALEGKRLSGFTAFTVLQELRKTCDVDLDDLLPAEDDLPNTDDEE